MAKPRLLQTKEIAHELGISTKTVLRWRKLGLLPEAVKGAGRTSPITMCPTDVARLRATRG